MNTLPSLKILFRANVLFSTACALDLFLFTGHFARWMGISENVYLQLLAGGLIGFAAFVFWVSSQSPISKHLALQVIAADLSWVVGSGILLAFNPFNFTLIGQVMVLAIGLIVLTFAILQIKATKHQYAVN